MMGSEEIKLPGEVGNIAAEEADNEIISSLEIWEADGLFPTKCPANCLVELDGVCPHGFESVALTYGFV